jgi:hypothetical protein
MIAARDARDFRTVAWMAARAGLVVRRGAPIHNFNRRYFYWEIFFWFIDLAVTQTAYVSGRVAGSAQRLGLNRDRQRSARVRAARDAFAVIPLSQYAADRGVRRDSAHG